MIRIFCDRCNIEGDCKRRQLVMLDELGDHVAKGKPLDLCATCAAEIIKVIGDAIGRWMSEPKERTPLELVKPPEPPPEPDPKALAELFGH